MKTFKITQNQPKLEVIPQKSFFGKILPTSIWEVQSYGYSLLTYIPKYVYNTLQTTYQNLPTVWDAKDAVYAKAQGVFDTTKAVYQNLPTVWDAKDAVYAKAQGVFDTTKAVYQNLPKIIDLKNAIRILPKIPSLAYKIIIQAQEELKKQTDLETELTQENALRAESQKTKYLDLTDEEKTHPNLLLEEGGNENIVIMGDNITDDTNHVE